MPVRPLPPSFAPLVLKNAAEIPRMKARCHDCAFDRGGSPEQRDVNLWATILRGVDRADPFFCHQGMPQDEDGKYLPEIGPDGRPVGAMVCRGYLEMRERFLAVQRADIEDE